MREEFVVVNCLVVGMRVKQADGDIRKIDGETMVVNIGESGGGKSSR